jgi:hypothetical protein
LRGGRGKYTVDKTGREKQKQERRKQDGYIKKGKETNVKKCRRKTERKI